MKNLKRKRLIEELTASAPSVVWPTLDDKSYQRFVPKLREVVRENISYSAAESLRFDREQGHFWFEQQEAGVVSGLVVGVTATFHIDPKKPLAAEIERVARDAQAFSTACNRAWVEHDSKKGKTP